jgi:hypothetical protein
MGLVCFPEEKALVSIVMAVRRQLERKGRNHTAARMPDL